MNEKKERETEAIRKREAYINKKNSNDSKIVEKKQKKKCRKCKKGKK